MMRPELFFEFTIFKKASRDIYFHLQSIMSKFLLYDGIVSIISDYGDTGTCSVERSITA